MQNTISIEEVQELAQKRANHYPEKYREDLEQHLILTYLESYKDLIQKRETPKKYLTHAFKMIAKRYIGKERNLDQRLTLDETAFIGEDYSESKADRIEDTRALSSIHKELNQVDLVITLIDKFCLSEKQAQLIELKMGGLDDVSIRQGMKITKAEQKDLVNSIKTKLKNSTEIWNLKQAI